MDANRFDRLARSLTATPSRRRFLGGLAAASGLLAPWASGPVEGKKKKRKKRKQKQKLKLNAFGCVDVGQACRGDDGNCCSGRCAGDAPAKGQKDESRCEAHNVGACQAGNDSCGEDIVVCAANTGACFRTTGNGPVCGKETQCTVCSKDTDCNEEDFGEGAACIVCADCDGVNGSQGTACVEAAARDFP